jgi:hypothetical protein
MNMRVVPVGLEHSVQRFVAHGFEEASKRESPLNVLVARQVMGRVGSDMLTRLKMSKFNVRISPQASDARKVTVKGGVEFI